MELKDLKVELRPHVGVKKRTIGGAVVDVPQDFRQQYVLVNGSQVGYYCGAKLPDGKYEKDKYLSFIIPLSDAEQKVIADKVSAITGGVGSFNAPPPAEHEVSSDDGE